MKKRLLSMVLTGIMLVSLIPTSVFAAKKSVDDYFDGLPIAADPGAGTTAWKVSTKDGEEVLMSGNAGKNRSSSTLTLTFTEDTHLTFEYKVSSEAKTTSVPSHWAAPPSSTARAATRTGRVWSWTPSGAKS